MHAIDPDSLDTIAWSLRWRSDKAEHEERSLARRVNFWRMGFVLHCFLETGGFADLRSVSLRNWWRPADDPCFRQLQASDPVFVFSGAKADS